MEDTDADLAFAQQVVVEYTRALARDLDENRLPGRADALPFGKAVIKQAIETSVAFMSSTSGLTGEMREFFETAYVSLAEYLDPELATLVLDLRRAEDAHSGRYTRNAIASRSHTN